MQTDGEPGEQAAAACALTIVAATGASRKATVDVMSCIAPLIRCGVAPALRLWCVLLTGALVEQGEKLPEIMKQRANLFVLFVY